MSHIDDSAVQTTLMAATKRKSFRKKNPSEPYIVKSRVYKFCKYSSESKHSFTLGRYRQDLELQNFPFSSQSLFRSTEKQFTLYLITKVKTLVNRD